MTHLPFQSEVLKIGFVFCFFYFFNVYVLSCDHLHFPGSQSTHFSFSFYLLNFVSLSPMLELGIQSRVNFIVTSCMGSSKIKN